MLGFLLGSVAVLAGVGLYKKLPWKPGSKRKRDDNEPIPCADEPHTPENNCKRRRQEIEEEAAHSPYFMNGYSPLHPLAQLTPGTTNAPHQMPLPYSPVMMAPIQHFGHMDPYYGHNYGPITPSSQHFGPPPYFGPQYGSYTMSPSHLNKQGVQNILAPSPAPKEPSNVLSGTNSIASSLSSSQRTKRVPKRRLQVQAVNEKLDEKKEQAKEVIEEKRSSSNEQENVTPSKILNAESKRKRLIEPIKIKNLTPRGTPVPIARMRSKDISPPLNRVISDASPEKYKEKLEIARKNLEFDRRAAAEEAENLLRSLDEAPKTSEASTSSLLGNASSNTIATSTTSGFTLSSSLSGNTTTTAANPGLISTPPTSGFSLAGAKEKPTAPSSVAASSTLTLGQGLLANKPDNPLSATSSSKPPLSAGFSLSTAPVTTTSAGQFAFNTSLTQTTSISTPLTSSKPSSSSTLTIGSSPSSISSGSLTLTSSLGSNLTSSTSGNSSEKLDLKTTPFNLVYFDLETTGLAKSSDIIQLSAMCGDQVYSCYSIPMQPIQPGASQVNKLTMVGNRLHYKGQPVDAKSIKDNLLGFLQFLKGIKNAVLVAHNCKNFDSVILVNSLIRENILNYFEGHFLGFLDSLPLLKNKLPNLPKHSLESVYTGLFQKVDFDAHSALEDVKGLRRILEHVKPNNSELSEHTFSLENTKERAKKSNSRLSSPTTGSSAPSLGQNASQSSANIFQLGGSNPLSAPPSYSSSVAASSAPSISSGFGLSNITALTSQSQKISSESTPMTSQPVKPSVGAGGFSFVTSFPVTSSAPTTTASSGFSFGTTPSTAAPQAVKPGGFSFNTTVASPTTATSTPANIFGAQGQGPAPDVTKTSTSGFPFGTGSATATTTSSTANTFNFGTSSAQTQAAPNPTSGFSFSGTPASTSATSIFGSGATSTQPTGGFAFGKPATQTSTAPGFGQPAPTQPASNPSSVFSFGGSANTSSTAASAFGKPTTTTSAPSVFGFGAGAKTTPAQPAAAGGFNFGASTNPTSAAPSGFSFGASTAPAQPAAPSGFNFGASSTGTQPPGFSFGASAPASTQATSGFNFGAPATTKAPSTPFGAPSTPAPAFGAPTPAAPFGTPQPAASGGIFGSQPTQAGGFGTATAATPFGNPTPATPFGAAQPAPSNPFGASQPTPATPFGASQPAQANPFGATQSGQGFNFGAPQPNNGFNFSATPTPAPVPANNAGSGMFSIGTSETRPGRTTIKPRRRTQAKR